MDKLKYETLGDPVKYKTLIFITDYLNGLEDSKRRPVIRTINSFIKVLKDVSAIQNKKLRSYLILLVRADYIKRTQNLNGRHSPIFVSHLRNFVITKIRQTLKKFKVQT